MDTEFKHLVAIRCYTYNHSAYIVDALNGFIMQQTQFPFVALIVDDASTDGEPQLLHSFFHDNFDVSGLDACVEKTDYGTVMYAQHMLNKKCYFAIVLLKENHYKKKSKIQYLDRWLNKVKYVALCEGDDYWKYPLKLQKQVDILESHPEIGLCCTGCMIETKGEIKSQQRYKKECIVPPEDIIIRGGLWIHTVTYLYRKSLLNDYPSFCKSCHVGDFPLILWASLNSAVYFIPTETSVYRYQNAGSWTARQSTQKRDGLIRGLRSEVDMLKGLDDFSGGKFSDAFNARIKHYLYDALINHKGFAKDIICEFREEIQLFDRKQKIHVLAFKMNVEPFYSFFMDKWHLYKKSIHRNVYK